MALTDKTIQAAKPKEKLYKLSDEKGMYLEVCPNGSRYWRLKYRFAGKEKRISLGVYPEVSLKEARKQRGDARSLLRNGVDPSEQRKAEKAASSGFGSFEPIAREWMEKQTWTHGHKRTVKMRLENFILPWIGNKQINDITPSEILSLLKRQENRGVIETAHRVKSICSQIFRYAIATGRAERDPAADLKNALAPTKAKCMATITDPREVGALLRAIDGFKGRFVTVCALKFAPLVFVRPGELRHAEWSEIDLDGSVWRLPAEKMKMKQPHIVPLSHQAVEILKELHPLTGHDKYVFPSIRASSRPMSDNTILAALRRLGYEKEEMSGHGFRAMASTLLHEQGWPSTLIERQLAHQERNKVKAAYNHAEHLPERKRMMQAWADYLDGIKNEVKIIQTNSTG